MLLWYWPLKQILQTALIMLISSTQILKSSMHLMKNSVKGEGGWSRNFCFYFYKMNKKCFKCDSNCCVLIIFLCTKGREQYQTIMISGEGCQLQALDFCSMLSDFVYIYISTFYCPFLDFLIWYFGCLHRESQVQHSHATPMYTLSAHRGGCLPWQGLFTALWPYL